ncbi:MAG: hypothetical protein EOO20_21820, partial [Chryseobacterium sp.]
MANPTIKYYPVCNGDQSIITLEDKTTILIDCNIREASKGDSDPEMYDVKRDLLNSIQRDNGVPFVDVFILTHGDQDHCRGYKANFYQGNPKDYKDKHKNEGLIRVDAMWFSPMIAEQYTNDDEDAYQVEAERRLKLHRNDDPDKDIAGNRIRIIGYDGNKDYEDLDHLRSTPGDVVARFNDKDQKKFSIFIHAPFKIHLDSNEKDKNTASIVFQARFKCDEARADFATLAMFGGDSDYTTWAEILDKTKRYGNDVSENALSWDLFLSPHHCSWSFFNDRPQNDNPDPVDTSLKALDNKRTGARVIASSKAIKDELGVTATLFAYPCGQKYIGRGKDLKSYVPLIAEMFS